MSEVQVWLELDSQFYDFFIEESNVEQNKEGRKRETKSTRVVKETSKKETRSTSHSSHSSELQVVWNKHQIKIMFPVIDPCSLNLFFLFF